MRTLIPWICLAAACGVQASYANNGYDAYRQGDYIKAAEFLSKSSDSSAVSEYYKGRMRLYGYGFLKNNQLALEHLKSSAEKGYLPAQNLLARYELLAENNPSDALHWFKKAADQGDIRAQMYCSAAYMFGYGVKKNPMMARRYYIAAAKNDNPIAQYTLAEYFLDSRHSQNRKLGLIWLNKSVELGNPKAQLKQGKLYAEGKYLNKDLQAARQLFQSAIDQGSIAAMYQMGKLELELKAYEKAQDWFKKASEKDYIPAQRALAKLYLLKDGPLYDPNNGFLWMLKAAQHNSKEAQLDIAKMYQEGIGVEKDENLAKEWKEKADKKVAKNEKSPQIEVAEWLSNGKSIHFADSGYILEGILSPWQNKNALSENRYNQSPQLWTVDREQLYRPKFELTSPSEVALSTYYNAIASSLNQLRSGDISLPAYKLTGIYAGDANKPLLPDSPLLSVKITYQNYLPQREEMGAFESITLLKPAPKQSPKSKLAKLRNHAILGVAEAQFTLGQLYEKGEGVYPNPETALQYYQLAADQLDLRAEYNLAMMYLYGKGIKPDYLKAENYLKDAAFKGNPQAQYALAKIKENGFKDGDDKIVIEKDNNEAIAMYYLASANNYGLAQYQLAEILVRQNMGDMSVAAISKKNARIKKLYQGALKGGVQEAALPLAYFNAMDQDLAKQQQAFKVAKSEAEKGNPQGALLVGLMLDRGLGVEKKPSEAIYWYQKTTENSVGAFILGSYLATGDHISKDVATGQKLLQRSADAGFSFGNLNLAVLKYNQNETFLPELDAARAMGNSKAGLLIADYYLSLGDSPEKMKQARTIYENFAKRGEKNAQLKLAYMFETGLGGDVDISKAQEWYERASNQKQPEARYLLARLYFMGKLSDAPDYKQAKHLLKNASAQYAPAAVALGFIYETVDDNYHQARTAYQLAAMQDNPIGQFNLGLMYEMGKGMPVNVQQAKLLYEKAAGKGHPEATLQLAGFSFNGVAGSKDKYEGLKLYKKAANEGDHEALYQLGLMAETGVEMDANMQEAMTYYQRSADKGNSKAKMALARIYQFGLGVPEDKQKAKIIYESLAKEHNPYAQFQLATLYFQGVDGTKPELKKGKALLLKAQESGYQQASRVLQLLEAQSVDRISYVEPVVLFNDNDVAVQSAEIMFMEALNEWNRGDENLTKVILNRLLMQFPHFMPAKRASEQLEQALLPMKLS